ncbi:MAG: amidohydrolase family protein, partial [Chloroflexota bacterium]|nr:amidohydrolase family protein [Chloroflexota bacterium]
RLRGEAAAELDARGGLVVPGLVDGHVHLDKALTADQAPPGQVGDLRTREGLERAIAASRELKRGFTVEGVRERAIRVARMAASAGTTLLRSHVDVDPIVGLTGIRGVLEAKRICAPWIEIQVVAFPQEGIFRASGTEELLRESLRLGADAVGGAPALDDRPAEHIRLVFRLAEEFGLPVDMHVDESDRPEDFTLPFVIDETFRTGVPAVTVAHISSLAAQPDDVAQATIAGLVEAGINVSVNPIIVKITRLRELFAAGANVMFGSDNLRDSFYPLGNANPLGTALLACQLAALGSERDLLLAFDAVTTNAARALGHAGDGVTEGAPADLVVFEAATPTEALRDQRPPRSVLKAGRLVPVG